MRIWDINPTDQTLIDPAGRDCPLDPMTGDPKIPGSAITNEPPQAGEHEVARAVGNAWEIVADWRGHVYWTEDGQRHEIEELGDEPPPGALDKEPPEPIERLAARKRAEINTARDSSFAAGLEYEINGEFDIIQTRPQDQINLLGLSAKAQLLMADGITDAIMPFRGLSNTTYQLTPQAMSELALAALAHIESIYQHSWEVKDRLDAHLVQGEREALFNLNWGK